MSVALPRGNVAHYLNAIKRRSTSRYHASALASKKAPGRNARVAPCAWQMFGRSRRDENNRDYVTWVLHYDECYAPDGASFSANGRKPTNLIG